MEGRRKQKEYLQGMKTAESDYKKGRGVRRRAAETSLACGEPLINTDGAHGQMGSLPTA